MMNEQLKVDESQAPSVIAAMGSSVVYVLIGLGVLAGIAGIVALMIAVPRFGTPGRELSHITTQILLRRFGSTAFLWSPRLGLSV